MKEVICDMCEKPFGTGTSLMEHFKEAHPEEWMARSVRSDPKPFQKPLNLSVRGADAQGKEN